MDQAKREKLDRQARERAEREADEGYVDQAILREFAELDGIDDEDLDAALRATAAQREAERLKRAEEAAESQQSRGETSPSHSPQPNEPAPSGSALVKWLLIAIPALVIGYLVLPSKVPPTNPPSQPPISVSKSGSKPGPHTPIETSSKNPQVDEKALAKREAELEAEAQRRRRAKALKRADTLKGLVKSLKTAGSACEARWKTGDTCYIKNYGLMSRAEWLHRIEDAQRIIDKTGASP